MKKKIIYLVLAVLTLGLLATSCTKADFLEGTVWVCHNPDENHQDATWTLSFINKAECTIIGEGYVRGRYYGEKDKITIEWDELGTLSGSVKDDEMKLHWDGDDWVYTFKKKK